MTADVISGNQLFSSEFNLPQDEKLSSNANLNFYTRMQTDEKVFSSTFRGKSIFPKHLKSPIGMKLTRRVVVYYFRTSIRMNEWNLYLIQFVTKTVSNFSRFNERDKFQLFCLAETSYNVSSRNFFSRLNENSWQRIHSKIVNATEMLQLKLQTKWKTEDFSCLDFNFWSYVFNTSLESFGEATERLFRSEKQAESHVLWNRTNNFPWRYIVFKYRKSFALKLCWPATVKIQSSQLDLKRL